MNVNELYDYMIDVLNIDKYALDMLTSINGFRIDVLQDALYYATGYHDIEQMEV